jgi:adenylate kinase
MLPSRDELEELVRDLQARVKQLEERLDGSPKPVGDGKGLRMILMGPPGAGMHLSFLCISKITFVVISSLLSTLIINVGKGTQAPKIKEKFACCHLVRSALNS